MEYDREAIRSMIIAFYELPGIGWHEIKAALDHRLWRRSSWTAEQLAHIGMRRSQAAKAEQFFRERPWASVAEQPSKAEAAGAVVITRYDSHYPDILKEIANPPWVLYAKGRLELLTRPAVAVVGTRVPTSYGRHTAAAMARELSASGVAVVSGLAKGIDSRAHLAALEEHGGTIAVLPTPIDKCYPAENESLYRRMAQEGLLLSETPFGTPLHRGQFHQRNRIIAALSRATIVVEGASRSGSLITAQHTHDMNRELFAVPGPISSPKSEGPNELIREGKARLISAAGQIFDELSWLRSEADACRNGPDEAVSDKVFEAAGPGPEELKLIRLLQEEPLTIDELHERLAIPFGHLNALLLNLCIKRKIELQPGSIYRAL